MARCLLRRPGWKPGGKRRPFAQYASHRDVAAHHLCEPPTDGEAQARAAVLSRGGTVRLNELLEQFVHLLVAQTDTGVRDFEDDPFTVVLPVARYRKRHFAILREFAGIAQKVEHNLPQPGHVGAQHTDIVGDVHHEPVAIPVGKRLRRVLEVPDQGRQFDVLAEQLDTSGFYLGEIQNVVDQCQ